MTRDYEWLDAAVVLFALGIVAFIAAALEVDQGTALERVVAAS